MSSLLPQGSLLIPSFWHCKTLSMVGWLQMNSLTELTETRKTASSYQEWYYFKAILAENRKFEGILPQTSCDIQHTQKNEVSDQRKFRNPMLKSVGDMESFFSLTVFLMNHQNKVTRKHHSSRTVIWFFSNTVYIYKNQQLHADACGVLTNLHYKQFPKQNVQGYHFPSPFMSQ